MEVSGLFLFSVRGAGHLPANPRSVLSLQLPVPAPPCGLIAIICPLITDILSPAARAESLRQPGQRGAGLTDPVCTFIRVRLRHVSEAVSTIATCFKIGVRDAEHRLVVAGGRGQGGGETEGLGSGDANYYI